MHINVYQLSNGRLLMLIADQMWSLKIRRCSGSGGWEMFLLPKAFRCYLELAGVLLV